MVNYDWYRTYSYDPVTGSLIVNYCPTGADNKIRIVAEGVKTEETSEIGIAGSTETASGEGAESSAENGTGVSDVAETGSNAPEPALLSDTVYEKPDGVYGPFDWKVTDGNGELKLEEETVGYVSAVVANYTPTEPGVSYLTATTKDGKYSINFAVVCEPIKPDTITIEEHNVVLKAGETKKLEAILSPERCV